jgi:hypothetical protein
VFVVVPSVDAVVVVLVDATFTDEMSPMGGAPVFG